MQLPGPTLIVHQGDNVKVVLTNRLPAAAGATSIIFAGQVVSSQNGSSGLLTREAATGASVTYTFTPDKPGTYAYYSGTQPDLQIEMGLTGALVVLPTAAAQAAACGNPPSTPTFANAQSAYAQVDSCYDREYLFQFTEMSSAIHDQVKSLVDACASIGSACPQIMVPIEPYHPNYFLINGRSMPDIMDTPYAAAYPNQPYNGNPHMHPGEKVLMRVLGQGRLQHPFHFHGNHARVLARDGGLLVSHTDANKLAGPVLFTIATVAGQGVDAIFTWTGQGLNWDVYGLDSSTHTCKGKSVYDPNPANPKGNMFVNPSSSYNPTTAGFDSTTHEYCLDHGKPIPATPPDPSIVVNGQWYGGTPYIGMQSSNPTPEAPGTLNQNPQAGYAYMWHSHNEREITTNDVFPGGMLMMLLIDPAGFFIDETL
jgi:hypothetical protein